MTSIRDEIQQVPVRERGGRKALRLAESVNGRLPLTWTVGSGQNRTQIIVTAVSFDGASLLLDVTATRGAWSRSDDVRIINPPIMVPTGRKIPNPDQTVGGLINECEENPQAAIKSVVEDAVRLWSAL